MPCNTCADRSYSYRLQYNPSHNQDTPLTFFLFVWGGRGELRYPLSGYVLNRLVPEHQLIQMDPHTTSTQPPTPPVLGPFHLFISFSFFTFISFLCFPSINNKGIELDEKGRKKLHYSTEPATNFIGIIKDQHVCLPSVSLGSPRRLPQDRITTGG